MRGWTLLTILIAALLACCWATGASAADKNDIWTTDNDRVGGDTIATATEISSLPFNDTGDTSGYVDDYDEACDWDSTSPDVVYAYTPGTTGYVSIDLYGSSYDTKVFVYRNTVGNLWGCNDDYYGDYTSFINECKLYAGETYYIVVDGWNGYSGPYVLNVLDIATPPEGACCLPGAVCELFSIGHCEALSGGYLGDGTDCASADCAIFECSPETLHGQNRANTAFLYSDQDYPNVSADNFSGIGSPICQVTFWGIHYDAGSTCDPLPTDFVIEFYQDDNGLPGATICTYSVTAEVIDIDQTLGGYSVFFHRADLSPCCSISDGWVSIAAANGHPDCVFYLINSDDGDGYMAYTGDLSTWNPNANDLAFCLMPDDNAPDTTSALTADQECYGVGDTVTAWVNLVTPQDLITGGQFFMDYDNTILDFEGFGPGSDPFDNLIYTVADEVGGTLDVAVGTPLGHPGTMVETEMVELTFTALQPICAETGLITFRPHTPPTRLSTAAGGSIEPVLVDLDIVDTTAPTITCPADVTVECSDSRDPLVNPAMGQATATDNCDPAPVITYSDAENLAGCGGYTGTVTRTWTATDHCGNSDSCVQTITVVDSTPPTLTCPGPVSVQCISDVPAVDTGSVTAADNCDMAPVVTHVGDVSDGLSCPETITRTYRATDACGNWTDCTQLITVHDTLPPSIACPADIVVNADAGGCSAIVSWTLPVASDNCDPSPAVVCVPAPGSGFTGTTTVTCTATDFCGNSTLCTFDVTVLPYNDLNVTLELSPTINTDDPFPQTLTRCITFELWDCGVPSGPTVLQKDLTFDVTQPGGPGTPILAVGSALIDDVPCGLYTCITARDELHTLRRTMPVAPIGTDYVADFATALKPLIGGNFNDDDWIDILDFGVFSWQHFADYGTGDTPCVTAAPHADVSGDGIVDTDDFSFIQINFLEGIEANCCTDGYGAAPKPPVTSITVEELHKRGLGHLAVADYNGDGVLNTTDITVFMGGDYLQRNSGEGKPRKQ